MQAERELLWDETGIAAERQAILARLNHQIQLETDDKIVSGYITHWIRRYKGGETLMSRSGSTLYFIAPLAATTILTACTLKGSMEQHTRHHAYASDDGFGPNLPTQKAGIARIMMLFFSNSGIWELKIKQQGNHGIMCNDAFDSFTARNL